MYGTLILVIYKRMSPYTCQYLILNYNHQWWHYCHQYFSKSNSAVSPHFPNHSLQWIALSTCKKGLILTDSLWMQKNARSQQKYKNVCEMFLFNNLHRFDGITISSYPYQQSCFGNESVIYSLYMLLLIIFL